MYRRNVVINMIRFIQRMFLTDVLKEIAIIKNNLTINQRSIPANNTAISLIVNGEKILKKIAEIGSKGKNTIEFQKTMLTAIGIEYLRLKNTEIIFKHKAITTINIINIKVTDSRNIKGSHDE